MDPGRPSKKNGGGVKKVNCRFCGCEFEPPDHFFSGVSDYLCESCRDSLKFVIKHHVLEALLQIGLLKRDGKGVYLPKGLVEVANTGPVEEQEKIKLRCGDCLFEYEVCESLLNAVHCPKCGSVEWETAQNHS